MGRREVRGKARRRKKSDIVARVRESLKGFGRNTTVARTLAKTRSEQESLTPSSDVMVSIGCMRAVMVLKMIDFVLFRKLPTASIELSFEVDQLSQESTTILSMNWILASTSDVERMWFYASLAATAAVWAAVVQVGVEGIDHSVSGMCASQATLLSHLLELQVCMF